MKKTLIIAMLFFCFTSLFSQEDKVVDYIVTSKNDTIFGQVKALKGTTRSGIKFNFIPENGEKMKCDKSNIVAFGKLRKTKLVKILTRNSPERIFRLMVIDPSKGDNKKDFFQILSEGKITLFAKGMSRMSSGGGGDYSPGGAGGGGGSDPKYYIQLENGEFIRVKRKTFKSRIAPILKACDKFNSTNTKRVGFMNIEHLVEVYNESCL